MQRRKFTASAASFITALLLGKSSKLSGQTVKALKTLEDIDKHTGEKITFSKVMNVNDEDCDGIIYKKVGNEYFKRDFEGNVSVLWFGAKGDGITDDTDAFNKALATAEKKSVYVPASRSGYLLSGTVTIPNNKNLIGDGKGNGVNTRTKITFTGTGILFNVLSYYTTIKDLHIVSAKDNQVDNTAFFIKVNQTIMENVTIDGFRTGIRNTLGHTTFSHFFKNVMVEGCGVGADFDTANNICFEGCFFDANDICARFSQCSQVVFSGGTVMQMHGNIATGFKKAETNDSKILDARNTRAITMRDCYFEVGAGSKTVTNQKLVTLSSADGFNFNGNYCISNFKPGQPPLIEITDDKCLAITITGNSFLRVGAKSYIVGTSGAGIGKQYNITINSNRISKNGLEIDNSFKPVLLASGKAAVVSAPVQIAYSELNEGNVHVYGTIVLSAKGSELGGLAIGGFPLPVKKSLNPDLKLLGSLMIKNMVNIKGGKYLEVSAGSTIATLKDENDNPIMMQDLGNNSVINFSINYPYSHATAAGA